MGILSSIFTWWNGATLGTRLHSWRTGRQVGQDAIGNIYMESKKPDARGGRRRWVMYAGSNDASIVPPDWHGWLHGTVDGPPDEVLPPPRSWQKPSVPNLTGTRDAYRPSGALEAGGRRQAATGDYEAWSPDQA